MARNVDLYPQILEISSMVWHKRPTTDTGDGPVYPTRCGKKVRTFTVNPPEPEGQPGEWETRCADGCYSGRR